MELSKYRLIITYSLCLQCYKMVTKKIWSCLCRLQLSFDSGFECASLKLGVYHGQIKGKRIGARV